LSIFLKAHDGSERLKALPLIEKDIANAGIVNRQNGYIFLRSKLDKTKTYNLDT
jgi:hypothetical protein